MSEDAIFWAEALKELPSIIAKNKKEIDGLRFTRLLLIKLQNYYICQMQNEIKPLHPGGIPRLTVKNI